ncbi:hypothetical protein FEK35_21810 [Nocardia cyriacigeorgica]|uniref:Uncharacterized protein n=2 Tax=Nocardia cyriacigeorgica TaxID=135487 RepID=A0A5R8PBH7_9NOCA|nr:hypothetical protein FEK35_21810 [Nocardia cyriacigeorgica]
MRMATGVGLRIAAEECTAAIVTNDGEPEYIVREPVLHMSDEGDAELGGTAPAGHTHTITGFAEAVGDPAGISVDDGPAYRAEDLVATALFCLINLTADHLNGAAEFYATHPGDWPQEQITALRDALDYLGLRSVVLVSEAELPTASELPADAGADTPARVYAYGAAATALTAVLATPAGNTPPDPATAENSTLDTDIIPAVPAPEPVAQAYSAAIPIAEPPATEMATEMAAVAPEAAPAEPVKTSEKPAANSRTPVLIAVAALFGLILGGIGVAVLFREDDSTPIPPMRDAKSEQVTVSPTPHAPPPGPLPVAPPPTTVAPPVTEDPPVTVAPTTEPEPAPPPPPSSPPPPPTSEPPTSTGSSSTSTSRPTTTGPFRPMPQLPLPPALEIPGTRR